jgi:hypothetical protein
LVESEADYMAGIEKHGMPTACAARPEAELQKHGIVIGEWRNGSAGVFEALG